jgi:hypothetical protein
MASPLFESNCEAESSPRDTYGLGGPPALREPCRPSAASCLELVCVAQGKVILAASTFRREKVRWDPCTGTSITAQSRCSSRSLPPLPPPHGSLPLPPQTRMPATGFLESKSARDSRQTVAAFHRGLNEAAFIGAESGACVAGPHSPWSPPFAPPAPQRIAPLCSSASQLLWRSATSRARASSATAPHLPDADRPSHSTLTASHEISQLPTRSICA